MEGTHLQTRNNNKLPVSLLPGARTPFSGLAFRRAKGTAYLLFAFIVICGSALTCARHKRSIRTPDLSDYEKNEQVFKTNEEAVKAGIYEEFVDSMLLKGERKRAPRRTEKEPVRPPTVDVPRKTPSSAPVAPQDPPPGVILGFRVQLGAFDDQASAESLASRAEMQLGSGFAIYVRYYAPLWKVQAGDCRSREEAEVLRHTLRRSGFPDAWIVSAGIKR